MDKNKGVSWDVLHEEWAKKNKEWEKKRNSRLGFIYKFYDWFIALWWDLNNIYPFAEIKYAIQRIKRGWSDRDTWEFDSYLTTVIRDGVKHLKKYQHGYPAEHWPECSKVVHDDDKEKIAIKNWHRILNQIIWSFDIAEKLISGDVYKPFEGENAIEKQREFIVKMKKLGHGDLRFLSLEEQKGMKEGFKLFIENLFNLWD